MPCSLIEAKINSLLAPAKHIQEKKPHPTSWISQTNVSAMFDNNKILLLRLLVQNNQTFHMFSLLDPRFVLRSRDLDVLGAQRIIGFVILITHKSTRL